MQGVSNAASMGGTVHLTSFSLLTAVISLAHFLSCFETAENTAVEFFFCYLSKWERKHNYDQCWGVNDRITSLHYKIR